MKLRTALSAILFGVFSMGAASAQEFTMNDVLDRDFKTFLEWFPGEYDNQEQVYFQNLRDAPEEERNERIHHIFHPVDLEAFPGETFYIQQTLDDDPSKIYRQRIYALTPDYEEGAIRLAIYTPNDPDALVDAHIAPSKLEGVTPNDMVNRPGCDVFWRKEASQFIGYMKPRACFFESQRSGKMIYIEDDLILTEDEIWISDRAEDEDGNYVFGNKAGIPHKNRKARRFNCWMAVKNKRGDGWTYKSGVSIHDQGGRYWMETDERRPAKAGIRMRNVVWPFGPNRNSLVLYAHQDDPNRAESYVWTEPTADRIALNLRWMQASCTLAD